MSIEDAAILCMQNCGIFFVYNKKRRNEWYRVLLINGCYEIGKIITLHVDRCRIMSFC